MHTSTKISVLFCVFTLVLAPCYVIFTGFFPGPVDSIVTLYILAPLILLHALAVAGYGAAGRKSALIYLGMLAILAAAGSNAMRLHTGYTETAVMRPFVALGWCAVWSAIGMTFSLGRSKDGKLGRPNATSAPSGLLKTDLHSH